MTVTTLSLCSFTTPNEPGSVRDSEQVQEPLLEITPSASEYEQLIDDLKELRDGGAKSNTQAILDAVHEKAEATDRVPATDEEKPT